MLITGLYAALCGLLLVIFSFMIIRKRFAFQTGIGDGGHEELQRVIRIHGNFTEFVPLALILIMLSEMTGTSAHLIHGMGLTLVIARILHAFGLNKSAGSSLPRMFGMIGTFLVILCASGLLIFKYATA
jgi:hypothetical protein